MTTAIGEALAARVRRQRESLGLGGDACPVLVCTGGVAPAIAERAAEGALDLVVAGRSDIRRAGAYFPREMLVRRVHLGAVPLLAVDSRFAGLGVAVAGIDFKELSGAALGDVSTLLSPRSILHLVHVAEADEEDAPRVNERDGSAAFALSGMAARIGRDRDLITNCHSLRGDPAEEILRIARESRADIVAAGSRGAGLLTRMIAGEVATQLPHQAACSVLIGPPSAAEELALELADEEILHSPGKGGFVPEESGRPHLA